MNANKKNNELIYPQRPRSPLSNIATTRRASDSCAAAFHSILMIPFNNVNKHPKNAKTEGNQIETLPNAPMQQLLLWLLRRAQDQIVCELQIVFHDLRQHDLQREPQQQRGPTNKTQAHHKSQQNAILAKERIFRPEMPIDEPIHFSPLRCMAQHEMLETIPIYQKFH